MCNFDKDKIILGDNLGNIYIFNFLTRTKRTFNSLESKIMQLKITDNKCLVTCEKGFAIFNLEGFLESEEKAPPMIFSDFSKQAYGLDIT